MGISGICRHAEMPMRAKKATFALPHTLHFMRSHLPNLLTLTNLFLGCCAVVLLLDGRPDAAAWCTLGSFACDYADGLVARALKVAGDLGRQLDSLADVVSFGVSPAAMLYTLAAQGVCGGLRLCPAALPAFILAVFAAYRLGKFNLDTRQKTYFLGLSTPAATVFVLGITLSAHHDLLGMKALAASVVSLYVLTAILSALMVSEIPMFGLKMRGFSGQYLWPLAVFAALGLALAVFLKYLALSVLVMAYIGGSLLFREKVIGEKEGV